jgi:hypothetical protein
MKLWVIMKQRIGQKAKNQKAGWKNLMNSFHCKASGLIKPLHPSPSFPSSVASRIVCKFLSSIKIHFPLPVLPVDRFVRQEPFHPLPHCCQLVIYCFRPSVPFTLPSPVLPAIISNRLVNTFLSIYKFYIY